MEAVSSRHGFLYPLRALNRWCVDTKTGRPPCSASLSSGCEVGRAVRPQLAMRISDATTAWRKDTMEAPEYLCMLSIYGCFIETECEEEDAFSRYDLLVTKGNQFCQWVRPQTRGGVQSSTWLIRLDDYGQLGGVTLVSSSMKLRLYSIITTTRIRFHTAGFTQTTLVSFSDCLHRTVLR
ncbi:hypothetical protein KSP40_PGU011463 [Platanthera guangdongensis]|uniref:Uncharacterized protein n=1 Tax=Platanthera guangdongensis TaxID=2320717 RepID=A0ABR2MPU5_9ASPA